MSNRSINVGGSAIGSILNTGDNATIEQSHNQIHSQMNLQAGDVDINQELAALRKLVSELQTQDKGKIERALTDVEEEIAKPEPDKNEIQSDIERVMGYVKKTDEYATVISKWTLHLTPIAIWLGQHADKFHF